MKKSVPGGLGDSKLAEILRGLSNPEFRELGAFLRSQYFNNSDAIIRLYSYLRKIHAKDGLDKIEKADIAKHIYPASADGAENDANIRKLLSNFTKLTEKFLAINSLLNDEYLTGSLLMRESAVRNYPKSFERYYRDVVKKLGNVRSRSTENYYYLMDAEQIYFQFKSKQLSSPEVQLGKISFALDLHYISIKLLHFYSILNLKLHYKKSIEFDTWAFDDITNFVERHSTLLRREHQSLYADYLSVKMLMNPDDANGFNDLRKYVSAHSGSFGNIEKHRMFIYLYNHSVYRFNKGYCSDAGEVFSIIKEMEDKDIPLWHYFAYHMYFINAVKYASMIGEFEWAERFIAGRSLKIHDDIRDQTLSLAGANLHFFRGDHPSALKQLLGVDYPNYSFYLGAKSILLKIYYMTGEHEAALSQIDAVRHYINRKDIIHERHAKQFSNFVNCIAKLFTVSDDERSYEISKTMKTDISATDRVWLQGLLRNSGRSGKPH
ncbi:MAG: hypothetical protein K1X85_03150 [Ignavibacteria bacterium]|nr:hypothetical protein [Ignavibacteria bacterium]